VSSDVVTVQRTIKARPADIRTLANWPADQEVLEVDLTTNEEHALTDDEIVDLKPGHGFGRKVGFKRGAA
jgi:hypothetical protein